jgi:hypothetical protein
LNMTEALLPPPSIEDVVSACCIEDYFVERDRMRRLVKDSNQLGRSFHQYPTIAADEFVSPTTFLWERLLSRWAKSVGVCRIYESGSTSSRKDLIPRSHRGSGKHLHLSSTSDL